MTTYIYLGAYLGSAILALMATPVVIWLARGIGALDHPNARSVHQRPTPRIGGIAIFFSSMCLIVGILSLCHCLAETLRDTRGQLAILLGAATFVFLVGLVDDLKGLPARFKFLAELLAAGVLWGAGMRINAIGVTDHFVLFFSWLSCPVTLLWIVGITNAINLSDGLDGLAAGISAIASGVIAIVAMYSGNIIMAVFALALTGSLSGFLVFNFHPAKVFMGDCGSLFLGFIIAAASVMCAVKSTTFVSLTLPALALGIPIFDTLFSMLRRFLERRSLFAPDRRHFHHRLLEMGLHQRQAVLIIYVLTLLFSGLGLSTVVMRDRGALIVFGGILLLLLVAFRIVGAVRLRETLARLQERYRLARQQREQQAAFEQAQLQIQQAHDTSQWWRAVCEVAGQMGFASVALTRIGGDGRAQTDFWQAPATRATIPRILRMTVPCGSAQEEPAQEFEIAICIDESLEDACRRASLFSRLIDTRGAIRVTGRAELVAAGAPRRQGGTGRVSTPTADPVAERTPIS
jgi:UDP-GlcNAc:undecaprenyl-phosphate GlcNAc-1-phosphate transferase